MDSSRPEKGRTAENLMSVEYLEPLYRAYLEDPNQVAPEWRAMFARLAGEQVESPRAGGGPSFRPESLFRARPTGDGQAAGDQRRLVRLQERIDQLIRNYRVRGHIVAKVDPLGTVHDTPPELERGYYGFTDEDMDRSFSTSLIPGSNLQTLRAIIRGLEQTYCGSIGVQFMHIDDLTARNWLQRRMEKTQNRIRLSREQQVRILTKLTDAVIFEEFVRRKYIGAKTFSLEGAESLIPMLDVAIDKAARQGAREVTMGMSHRGRLNVLANIVGKSFQDIFREFEDVDAGVDRGRGDVKYHLGYHNYFLTASGREVHVSLSFNPSHLEFVDPVAQGRLRAKQDRFGDTRRRVGVAMLIHGDAAFAGEGIVQESLNLSQLPGYKIGGTVHVIVNNQIGFTTPPGEGRSSAYATDVAKMLQIPIFHVNGQDPEAVTQVVDLALDFRQKFQRDVVIDMYCYRRWGHNEGDEPAFTQPKMVRLIKERPSVRQDYLERLLKLGGITVEEADQIARRRREILEERLSEARRDDFVYNPGTLESMWEGYFGHQESRVEDVPTGVEQDKLVHYLQRLTDLPDGFHLHPKLKRLMQNRRAMAEGKRAVDWATAEALALASLLAEGHRVRISGQDSQRGTFSHRHAVLHDVQQEGRTHTPLAHVGPDQASVEIINSPLTEGGVLGFEYGYSLALPDGLVVWEAQFGDFANAAQVIIDQFIASGEDKWRHLSGLVMLLPHGFEGQGPEHSSARLERFLCLAAEDNVQIVVPTTPAQYFHVLRRQVIRPWRKPLVVMTPKSLLRHKRAVSSLDQFTDGRFQRVIPDEPKRLQAERVLLCSGKIYYDLLEAREKLRRDEIALVRVEQLYPFSEPQLEAALEPFGEGTPVYWVQEEPENMGAWAYLRFRFGERLFSRYPFAGITRPASASPATGSASSHRLEQESLIATALGDAPPEPGAAVISSSAAKQD
jgi:2-oxoglutarate dehydrogenase E1 component